MKSLLGYPGYLRIMHLHWNLNKPLINFMTEVYCQCPDFNSSIITRSVWLLSRDDTNYRIPNMKVMRACQPNFNV